MNEKKSKRLLVMAGGTGGHIFPALSVANVLQEKGWEIKWLGTKDRMEADLVPKHGIEIEFIEISGIKGKGLTEKLKFPFKTLNAVLQAKKIIQNYKPNAILGMGGYVSGPGGLAGKILNIPIIIHEQNGIAGMTNKWLSKFATETLQAFPSAFPGKKVVGNPVRRELITLPLPEERFKNRENKLRILIVGGSQGAKIINETIPEVAKKLGDKATFWHQVGKNNLESVKNLYGEIVNNHKIVEFIDNMDDAYAWADLIICRSGALTVSEISIVGLAAIFIPFMHKDRQQYWNAKQLDNVNACKIIEQSDLNIEKLVDLINGFTRDQLLEMANRAREIAIFNSAERVAETIEQLSQPI